MSPGRRGRREGAARSVRLTRFGGVAAVALAILAIPPLAGVPARLVEGCGKWIAFGAALELLSILGYVLVFGLVFCARMNGRQSLGAALRALGASTALPAGGVVGPAMGVRTADGAGPPAGLIRSTLAFGLLTNAPSLIVLGVLGLSLALGWPSGPHSVLLTLPAAAVAWALLVGAWLIAGSAAKRRPPEDESSRFPRQLAHGLSVLRDGAARARLLLAQGNWKLVGAVGYYAFDNAVLWASFRAYGHAPPLGVIVMGYLVGSLGAALPVPGGIGPTEGGLIGALVLYGAPAGPAAAAVLLYRGLSLALPLTLGAAAWARSPAARRGRRAMRHSMMRRSRTGFSREPDAAPVP